MPQHLSARPPLGARQARQVRKLAHSAEELGCHPETIRHHPHAFSARGLDRLGMKPGSGRKPRLTRLERETNLALALTPMPAPGPPPTNGLANWRHWIPTASGSGRRWTP